MKKSPLVQMDLSKRADNGLARGYTTGVCATAAVKAAVLMLECGMQKKKVSVTLADERHYLIVPVQAVRYK